MKTHSSIFILTLFTCLSFQANAQKQFVLLKKQKVILRLNPGDDFVYSLKGQKGIRHSYINNLSDTSVTAHQTVVPFHKIDRIYFKRSSFVNRLGGVLVIGGAGIFIIDQFNTVVVHGEDPVLDDRVMAITITGLAAGLPMMLIRKKSQRIKAPYHLLTIKEGSVFYTEPSRQMIIENK